MAFKNGTSQGNCLSPTLYSYVRNRLLNLKLPTSVKLVAYADDLALSCCHPDKCKVRKNIQTAIDSLNAEATSLGMKFTPAKSKAMWFYINTPDDVITLSDQKLPWSPNERYLGVELDSKMNFTPQPINAAAQGKKNINALKVVSSITDISAHIYIDCVQLAIEYGVI